VFAWTVAFSTADPEIVGAATLVGRRAAIVDVGFDVDRAEPELFAAVTRARRRKPTSAPLSVYDFPVAPEIEEQLEPSAAPPSDPHRNHRYEKVMGCVPDHEPFEVVRFCPSRAIPVMAGSPVFPGASAGAATDELESAASASAAMEIAATAVAYLPRSHPCCPRLRRIVDSFLVGSAMWRISR
jgi:hypothetical protein